MERSSPKPKKYKFLILSKKTKKLSQNLASMPEKKNCPENFFIFSERKFMSFAIDQITISGPSQI